MAKKKEKKQVSSEPAVGRALLLAPLGLLAVIAALVLGLSKQNAQSIPAFLEMEKWVEKNGGRVSPKSLFLQLCIELSCMPIQ